MHCNQIFADGGISRIGILGNAQRVNMAISSSAEAAVDKNLEGVDKSRDLVKKARNDTKKNDSFHSKLEQMKM